MKNLLTTIISLMFFGNLVFAQLTEFSQGDILSAGATRTRGGAGLAILIQVLPLVPTVAVWASCMMVMSKFPMDISCQPFLSQCRGGSYVSSKELSKRLLRSAG